MKKLVIGLISFIWLVSACAPTTQATPISVPVIHSATATPSPIPTATQTSFPTETPTPSITPLPTIPTFTPTFDVSTILTVTPAPKAECPKTQPSKTDSKISITSPSNIIDGLNQGIPIETIEQNLDEYYRIVSGSVLSYSWIDVTNDGAPELIIRFSYEANSIYVLKCQTNQYVISFSYSSTLERSTYKIIMDANKNELPEIFVGDESCSSTGCFGNFFLLEWNQNNFDQILKTAKYDTFLDSIEEKNIDNDELMEIYWVGGVPVIPSWSYSVDGPWRLETHTYKWNGTTFAPMPTIYESPKYRFQAIQDADQKTSYGQYEEANKLYQDAISNKNLDWWSPERYSHQHEIALMLGTNLSTPTLISPDTTEYPSLAAYAYYRIMLLHIVQGNDSDATTVYNTLQQKFGSDPYGSPYVEMATAFWDAYQSTHKMYDGCAVAIQYAAEHPDILIPLGSDYHGSQAKIYKPEDVCPFR